MQVTNLARHRDKRDAEKYRLLQAAARLKLFKQEHGHDARDMEELENSPSPNPGPRPIDPYVVLTREEIEATLARYT